MNPRNRLGKQQPSVGPEREAAIEHLRAIGRITEKEADRLLAFARREFEEQTAALIKEELTG